MSKFKMMLLGTVAGITAVASAPASAGEVEKTVSVAGQVARQVMIVDDGVNTTIYGADNDNSSSRLKFTGQAKSETLTVKAYAEFNVVDGETTTQNTGNGSTFAMRQSYVSVANDMGTLSVGRTTAAGYTGGGKSFSGVGTHAWSDGGMTDINFIAVGTTAGMETPAYTASGVTIGTENDSYVLGRVNTVKYASPSFNGFAFQIGMESSGTDSMGSSASGQISYSADYDGTKVAAAVSGNNSAAGSTTIDSEIQASLAVELANGLNGGAGWGKNDRVGTSTVNDPEGWNAHIGYDAAMVDAGETSFKISYEENEDRSVNGDKYEALALHVEQDLSAYGASIFGSIENHEYSTVALKYQDITAGWVGLKVSF